MRKIIKYLSIAKINSQARTVHPANLLARGLSLIFRIWMFSQMYMASYATLGMATINGFTLAMTMWNIMLVQCFRSATRPRVSEFIDQTVKEGSLAYSLNKPYSFILFHYFSFLGRVMPGMILNLIIGITTVLFLVGPIHLSTPGLLVGMLLLFLGYTLDFFMNFLIGLSAFWLEDTTAADWIYQRTQYVLGGLIVPISLFPEKIARIAEFLPFSQLYYGAAQNIVKFDQATVLKYLSIQSGWIIIASIATIIAFRQGIKYVSLNGG